MAPKTLLLTVTAALALTVPAATAAEDWSGRGQIRTLYNQGNHEDLGCLNSRGQWIVDEPLCGVFEAVRRPESGQFIELYSVEHGRCWVDNVYFRCSAEGEGRNTTFGTFGVGVPVDGREVLRYGQYGVFATDGISPPKPGEALDIHFWGSLDQGKYAWLGWKPF